MDVYKACILSDYMYLPPLFTCLENCYLYLNHSPLGVQVKHRSPLYGFLYYVGTFFFWKKS